MNYVLSHLDIVDFKKWINLDLESLSWEGRYLDDFNDFWDLFFCANSTYQDQFEKFNLAITKVYSGPLVSWFYWLEGRLICYLFIYRNVSLKDLRVVTKKSYGQLSLLLREFFLDRYPHLEELLNDELQINSVTHKNIDIKFEVLQKRLQLNSNQLDGDLEGEVFVSMEVTLFPDWRDFYNYLEKASDTKESSIQGVSRRATYKKQIKFLKEVTLLFIIGGFIILTIKFGNKYYEDYLVKRISLFVPNFFETEKNLSFQSLNPLDLENVELSSRELEELERAEADNFFQEVDIQDQYDGESDVVLTSIDSLPRDFSIASLEQSEYEEVRKGGYRNTLYGGGKAYRIMMTSVDPVKTKNEIINMLNFYDVKKADNVAPGTQIPGGVYFNLYVARTQLTEFISRVTTLEESTILESNTTYYPPKGTNRVFIWIKNI